MRDCSVDFAFFKKSVAKTVAGNEVIGPYCHRPLVMNDRVVDSFLLNKSVAESHLGIWIIWLARYGSAAISDCLVHFAFLEKRTAEIVIRIPKIRLHFQSCPVIGDCLVNFAFLEKHNSQVIVRHPAIGISGQRRPPERFDVAVHRALPPRQCRQGCNNTHRRTQNQGATPLKRVGQIGHTRRSERNWSDTSQILVMVCDKRVAKCVEHDEAQYWTEGRYEKYRCDLDTPADMAPQKTDCHAENHSRQQPRVIVQMSRRDIPSRINEG